MKLPIAYQIYSARDEAQADLNGVLAQIKALGYDGVEFAGFYGHAAEDVKAMLSKHCLTAISSHVPILKIMEDMFGVISYHKTIGCSYIAVPFLDESSRPGAAGFAGMLKVISQFGRLCKEAGIQLLYHNHDFEFLSLSGQYGLDFLYEAVPADILQTEIDTCWVKYAGLDPAEYVRKYAGRCPVVHLKDYVGRRDGKTPYGLIGTDKAADTDVAFSFKPVGLGCQDIPSIVAAAVESGAKWLVVEQDLSTERPPLVAAKLSRDYLKSIGQ